jgi:competence protein ComEC
MAGPDVTRLKIAPFLWHRGIRRLDEVFLSHGDLDHFNGLPALLERFTVGQVTYTPSFADKNTPGVREAVVAIEQQAIPTRVIHAGAWLSAGDVEIEVLHPPAQGPEGIENVRSLVLLVRHAGHSLLLTGDLEGPGLERMLALPPLSVDVLMAPHHGSRTANPPALASWARPRVVVSSEGPPRGPKRAAEPYSALGARFLSTWADGATTIHSRQNELAVETFQSGQRFVLQQ